MTRRRLMPTALLIVLLAGCGKKDEVVWTTVSTPKPLEVPQKPLISCKSLVEKDGLMLWKDTGKPFTGATITYEGGIGGGWFWPKGYIEGKEAHLTPWNTDNGLASADNEIYYDALRVYLDECGPSHNE